jgi:hypothetical protein
LVKHLEAVFNAESVAVAVPCDANAGYVLHYEIGTAVLCSSRLQDLGNIRMVHQGQGLTFGLEASKDLFGVHPEFNDLESHFATDRFGLLGQVNDSHPTFTQYLQDSIGPNYLGGLDRTIEWDSPSRRRALLGKKAEF